MSLDYRLYTVVLLLGKSSWGLMYEVASKNGGQLLCSIEVIISTLATRENCQNSVICQILRWILGFLSFEWLQSARGKRAAFLRQLWILTFRPFTGKCIRRSKQNTMKEQNKLFCIFLAQSGDPCASQTKNHVFKSIQDVSTLQNEANHSQDHRHSAPGCHGYEGPGLWP